MKRKKMLVQKLLLYKAWLLST